MDVMDEELLNFWRVLNHNSVQYIMVGGFAVNMQEKAIQGLQVMLIFG